MRCLVIAAHPDDEVLGCGGTIARLAGGDCAVVIMILGEGQTSRFERRTDADPKSLSDISALSRDVGALLGATEVLNIGLPDNRFDEVPLLDVIKLIEKTIKDFEPHEIFTQHGGDLNIDHVVTFRATLTAARPMAGTKLSAIHTYEVASSTEWAFQRFAPVFRANYFVDISTTIEAKIHAMEMYESERRAYPHPRSARALDAIARRWGSVVGLHAAEAFETIWRIR